MDCTDLMVFIFRSWTICHFAALSIIFFLSHFLSVFLLLLAKKPLGKDSFTINQSLNQPTILFTSNKSLPSSLFASYESVPNDLFTINELTPDQVCFWSLGLNGTAPSTGPPTLTVLGVIRHLVVFSPYCISTALMLSLCCHRHTGNTDLVLNLQPCRHRWGCSDHTAAHANMLTTEC